MMVPELDNAGVPSICSCETVIHVCELLQVSGFPNRLHNCQ